ncbi:myosin-1-like [Macadamia integrifolia]|nr:myosin-1-like [Macadamia integrifolia]
MKSMEEVWQKQMKSLQSSLSIAKKSLEVDDAAARSSDASASVTDDRDDSSELASDNNKGQESNGVRSGSWALNREMSAGFSVITRLAEEFEQRTQVFSDDAKFLVEVKSGQAEASIDPDQELKRLKQSFESWKKDYASRLRETKAILQRFGTDTWSVEKVKKKWWERRNSVRFN